MINLRKRHEKVHLDLIFLLFFAKSKKKLFPAVAFSVIIDWIHNVKSKIIIYFLGGFLK